ncbi:hypothetical protein EV363DRAFT_1445936 [Boletus edulis]|uniref:Uncharacterized protein n=1 Tax=Boletus edulis BED1 TaxID=1328754 RepID=A0AAD4G7H5_BOLED|nr:hypothetical protein EV363DRAFT_1445936 [Boletus edulis]KAF8423491.1 hypothetical protein L210DRAFT_3653812 [Boletus edulis BED1]
MSVIWARLRRIWSGELDDDTMNEPAHTPERRGRDAFVQSFGRGGLGKIKRASQSRDAHPADGPYGFSHSHDHEPIIQPNRVFSVGRGGTGNIRFTSRDALGAALSTAEDAAAAKHEAKLVRVRAEATTIHSSGRGGSGNIYSSRS